MTRAEEIRQTVADDIVSGRLAPGQKLEEKALAARFGASRTPVRDALRELSGTGLVQLHPNRGARVAKVDVRQLQELFEAHAEIEALCARFSALRATGVERKQLELLHGQSEQRVAVDDDAGYAALNDQVHDLLYRGAHNAVLAELGRALRRRAAPFRLPQFYTEHRRMKSSLAEHDAVVQAVLAADPQGAADAMHAHIASTSIHVIRFFEHPR